MGSKTFSPVPSLPPPGAPKSCRPRAWTHKSSSPRAALSMSALGCEADISPTVSDVRSGPIADICEVLTLPILTGIDFAARHMAASGAVPSPIYGQRLASFSIKPTLSRIATASMADAQVTGLVLLILLRREGLGTKVRALAGEVERVWGV